MVAEVCARAAEPAVFHRVLVRIGVLPAAAVAALVPDAKGRELWIVYA